MFRKKISKITSAMSENALNMESVAGAEVFAGWSQARRCHRCGKSHFEEGSRVTSCDSCGARFAPFFFAEHTPESLERRGRPASLALKDSRGYRPVLGITWWWNENEGLASEFARMPRA